jgi:oxygen-independent coproporphyrinogen-3 oxidase
MGRKADRAQVLDFLDLLVKTDQAAVVIDLIYGFPGQTIDDFEDDVCTAIATGIDGLDLYSLNLIPGTPLLSVIEKGKSAPPAPVNRLGAYYERGAEVLDGARWDRISTTHWRSSTRERNLYNLLVKKGANCLAYGSGAGGFAGGYSYRIDRDLESYMARADKKQIPLAHLMRQSRHHRVLNQIKGQLETGKLNLGWLADELSACGLAYEDIVAPLVAQWKRAGLLELRGSWADLTLAGRFWQVALAQGLLEWLGQALSAPASADLETL